MSSVQHCEVLWIKRVCWLKDVLLEPTKLASKARRPPPAGLCQPPPRWWPGGPSPPAAGARSPEATAPNPCRWQQAVPWPSPRCRRAALLLGRRQLGACGRVARSAQELQRAAPPGPQRGPHRSCEWPWPAAAREAPRAPAAAAACGPMAATRLLSAPAGGRRPRAAAAQPWQKLPAGSEVRLWARAAAATPTMATRACWGQVVWRELRTPTVASREQVGLQAAWAAWP
mmetsp:Transcript_87921/g.284629  ORF Transcript_87921/g.284629 Transcript_87921/m.284629 type:complete len:229 (-) Transcript_87921:1609-2295(-)